MNINSKLFDKWVQAGLLGKEVFLGENELYHLLHNQYKYDQTFSYSKKDLELVNASYLTLISRIFDPKSILWKFCSIQAHVGDGSVEWSGERRIIQPKEETYRISIQSFGLNDPVDSIIEKLYPLVDQLKIKILIDIYNNLRSLIIYKHVINHPPTPDVQEDLLFLLNYGGPVPTTCEKIVIGNSITISRLFELPETNGSPVQLSALDYKFYGFPYLPQNELLVGVSNSKYNTSSFVYSPHIIFQKMASPIILKTSRNFYLFDSNRPFVRINFDYINF